jgi:hypothetical protein
MRRWGLALLPLLIAASNGSAPLPPATPVITEPSVDGQIVNPSDVHMEAPNYSDPDGDAWASSDIEIWKISPLEKIWDAPAKTGVEKAHLHLGDGTFIGSYTGQHELAYGTDYKVRWRYRDVNGEVSAWAERFFKTAPPGPPGVPGPIPWSSAPGFTVEAVAGGFEMPVNIAFVPNPGPNQTDPLFYVSELYGTIKVVLRNGTVETYAGASALGASPNPASLLNYNPTGAFPGSGEQGLAGLCVDPASGDVFVSLLFASPAPDGPHYPKVMRLSSTNGGHSASTQTTILQMPGESQGQSHFISNLSIGPDGKLYVHNGDGFDYTTAQNLSSFRGKILRMNLDGSPVTTNPFYSAADGINAKDYVWAYGLRNPFGGTWRASDGSHYEVENGPSVDRFAKVVAGQNLGWDNTDASMANFAIYNWSPAHAPVNVAFIQPETFTGSGFPFEKRDHAFVTESGPTYAGGPQTLGKRIVEFVLDSAGNKISGPSTLIEYTGTGRATAVGLAAGPDGLYFTELYKDQNAASPVEAGARVMRIRFLGTGTPIGNGTGLKGDYYNGTNFDTFIETRTDPTVNFNWGGRPTDSVNWDNFSVRWTGFVTAQTSETYTFTTNSDDGARLWVNGQPLVDNWINHSATENSGQIALQAGQTYSIRMDFYEGGGNAIAQLYWSTPTIAKQIIPQSQLSPTAPGPVAVADPTYSPPQGGFSSPMSVTISSATAGASIRYTTDGSSPSSSTGTLYASPVPISGTTTFKAIAYKSGMSDSQVISSTYTFVPPTVASPTFSPAPGPFSSPMSVTMSSLTAGASIRYTTDGTTPTSSTGTLYAGPVSISATTTFRAIAYKSGMSDSSVSTAGYTFTPPTAASPTYSPTPGTFTGSTSVTISSATAGASIRYTTDGSTPTSTLGTLYAGPVTISASTTFRAVAYASGMADSTVSSATYTLTVAAGGNGLQGDYYNGTNFDTLILTRIDPTVNFSWSGRPADPVNWDNFSVRWTGFVTAQSNETYTFITTSDDGVRLWVNGQLIIDDWVNHGPKDDTAQMVLQAGQSYSIRMDFYEGGGQALAQLSWSTPTITRQIIPQSQLSTTAPGPVPVANPTYSPAPGNFSSPMSVTLSSTTAGASIRYTTDGSTPTSSTGTLYAGPVSISATTSFKAIAYNSGMADSAVTSATYTFVPPAPVANPTYSPAPGNFSNPMSVTISSATAGASIRYTTDGSNPTSSLGTLYAGPVSISATTTFRAIAYKSGMTDSSVTSATYTFVPGVVADPTYSPAAGNFSSPMSVTIASSTAGASIRYTTDGTTPTSSTGTLYAGPVAISATTSFRAIAYKSGMTDSAVTSATYTFVPPAPVANPTYSPAPGNFSSPMSVTISSTTAGASIRYTTDGSTPTSSSGTIYAGPVAIGATTTFRAIAYKSGMTDSAVTSATYTFTPPVANPTYSPTPGSFTGSISVTIATTTSGATIRYTTDGSTPTSSAGTVYAGPVSISATTTFRAIAYKSGMPDSSVSAATYTLSTAGTGSGLNGDYYNGTNFDTFILTRLDPTINFNWGGRPAEPVGWDNFSVRWTGFVTAQSSETYTFFTNSDDGVRLWVNGQLLVDNWTNHGATENSGQIALQAGQSYSIQIEFFEGGGNAIIQLSWATSTIAKQIVPQARLSPSAPPPSLKAATLVDATAAFQALLDAAGTGDTVTLDAGTFLVSGGLFVPAGVSLRGAGPGRTILHGNGAPAVLRLMGGAMDGSSIVEGLTLTGGSTGLLTGSASAFVSHLVVAQNSGPGIVGDAGGVLTADHVTVSDNDGDGLSLSGAAVLRNSIVSGNFGFGVLAPKGAIVVYSDIVGNASGPGVPGGMDAPITFVDPAAMDYRATPGSATIDQGDPADAFDAEPSPNGGRTNQGAYGNTADAEASPLPSKSGAPVSSGTSSGGGCGATGLEALLLIGLLGARRKRR